MNRLGLAVVLAACSLKAPATSDRSRSDQAPARDDNGGLRPGNGGLVFPLARPSIPAPSTTPVPTVAPAPAGPIPPAAASAATANETANAAANAANAASRYPQRVVIISEDGMRPDALTPRTAPTHLALMHDGMSARRAFTVRPSETLASHASMLSGFAVADHKLSFDGYRKERGQITLPTIFSIAREHGRKTAMFIGKQKLWHIAPTGSVDHYEKPGFFCKTVARRAAQYFEAERPDLMFVHITDPDNAGHERGWMSAAYMAAVREADRCLRTLLDAIDRTGLSTSTLVIVTADHGGSGRSHSGRGKDLDRKIPWIARGPSIPPNSILDAELSTLDTAVTALAALRLPPSPGMIGTPRFPPAAGALRIQ